MEECAWLLACVFLCASCGSFLSFSFFLFLFVCPFLVLVVVVVVVVVAVVAVACVVYVDAEFRSIASNKSIEENR